MSIYLICFLIFLFSLFGSYLYRDFASKNKIVALLNFRTLHQQETPKGGGIIISFVFVLSILIITYLQFLEDQIFLMVCLGAAISSLAGFVDDLYDLKPIFKVMIQSVMTVSILFLVSSLDYFVSGFYPFLLLFPLFIFLIWVINSVNFMDGIDGLCSSLTICILSTATYGMYLSGYDSNYYLPFIMLSSVCGGFLVINFSSKKLFMGDSGSLFLGYLLCAFSLRSIMEGHLSFWFWSILFSYILTETTSTTIYRIFNLKNWYGAHRSHAYQNLARVLDDHKFVTSSIIAYHFFWLAPLAIGSIVFPHLSFTYLVLAIFPVLVFNLVYGPRFSNS